MCVSPLCVNINTANGNEIVILMLMKCVNISSISNV